MSSLGLELLGRKDDLLETFQAVEQGLETALRIGMFEIDQQFFHLRESFMDRLEQFGPQFLKAEIVFLEAGVCTS